MVHGATSPFWLVVVLIGALTIGRSLGWGFAKAFLYPFPKWLAYPLCASWAVGFSFLARHLIVTQQPGWILKIIIFGEGAYLACANYGLFREDSVPPEEQSRHCLLSEIPLPAYVIGFLAFAYL
jgi:hypothetical protein